ncbi:MAG: SH3 domain-containing protein, partial [Xanthomonadaceae bacterium]|nr:SH3 domain-containing protein [Xanthomonadaceae bacterium]
MLFWLAFCPQLANAGTSGVPATRGVVKVSGLNIRKTPNKHSRRLFGLSRRTRVEVVEERGSWVKIRTGSGREGWAFRSLLKIIRPQKTLPDITLEQNNISQDVGSYFSVSIPALRKNLQSYFSQRLNLVISKRSGSESEGKWLMVLEIPFTLDAYGESKGRDVGEGTIDLLPYLRYLHGLLLYRDAVLNNLKRHPYSGPVGDMPLMKGDISCYVNLVKDHRDVVFLTGKLDGPFAVFADY